MTGPTPWRYLEMITAEPASVAITPPTGLDRIAKAASPIGPVLNGSL